MSLKVIKIFVDWYNKSHYGSFAILLTPLCIFIIKRFPYQSHLNQGCAINDFRGWASKQQCWIIPLGLRLR